MGVLCQNCQLPEIDLRVRKDLVGAKCKACGWTGELDNAHNVAAYIVRNPPDADGFGEEPKPDRKARQAARAAKSRKEATDSHDEDGSDDDKEMRVKEKDQKEK